MPFTLEALCAGLGAQRGRPVELLPMTSQAPPWSFWVAGRSADWIFYESRTTAYHRQQMVLLQLGHLLLGHAPGARVDPEIPINVFGGLDSPAVHDLAVGRIVHHVDHAEELEADLFGCLLLQRVSQMSAQAGPTNAGRGDAETAELAQLAAVLEGRRR